MTISVGDLISYRHTHEEPDRKTYCVVQRIEVRENETRYWGIWKRTKEGARESAEITTRQGYVGNNEDILLEIEEPCKIQEWRDVL